MLWDLATFSGLIAECGHTETDVFCQFDYCIINLFGSASCDYRGPDRPCKKKHCDTAPDGNEKALEQILIDTYCSGGNPVIYTEVWRIYYGCESDCVGQPYVGACIVGPCGSGPVIEIQRKYQRYECGCP